jgi:hypothetical protein
MTEPDLGKALVYALSIITALVMASVVIFSISAEKVNRDMKRLHAIGQASVPAILDRPEPSPSLSQDGSGSQIGSTVDCSVFTEAEQTECTLAGSNMRFPDECCFGD